MSEPDAISPLPGAYGWKSKHSKLTKTTPQVFIPDYSAKKRKKKLQRMTYAPEFGAYAADILVIATRNNRVYYLLFQNINTRFLYAFPIPDKRKETLFSTIQTFYSTLLENGKPFHSLIADGEKGWTNHEVKNWLREQKIRVDFTQANYIHRIPILDSTMKTLRMGCNYDSEFMADPEQFEGLIHLFNNSINKTTKITPAEMEAYEELEAAWIRHCRRHNAEIERAYSSHYELGNILLVHFDESKTSKKFEKEPRKRQYSDLCEFMGYVGKNLAVQRLAETKTNADSSLGGVKSTPAGGLTKKGQIDKRKNPKKDVFAIPFYYAVWVARSISHARKLGYKI
jgi:hypothetical protein